MKYYSNKLAHVIYEFSRYVHRRANFALVFVSWSGLSMCVNRKSTMNVSSWATCYIFATLTCLCGCSYWRYKKITGLAADTLDVSSHGHFWYSRRMYPANASGRYVISNKSKLHGNWCNRHAHCQHSNKHMYASNFTLSIWSEAESSEACSLRMPCCNNDTQTKANAHTHARITRRRNQATYKRPLGTMSKVA